MIEIGSSRQAYKIGVWRPVSKGVVLPGCYMVFVVRLRFATYGWKRAPKLLIMAGLTVQQLSPEPNPKTLVCITQACTHTQTHRHGHTETDRQTDRHTHTDIHLRTQTCITT